MGKNGNLDDIFDLDDDFNDWIDGCYDEDGMGVTCDWCSSDIVWHHGKYICRGCGKEFERAEYFNYIGAEPPDAKCIFCDNNYPVCKRWCDQVEINPSDSFF